MHIDVIQSTKWHGYVLTNNFDYDDWFDHMSNNHLIQFDPKKPLQSKGLCFNQYGELQKGQINNLNQNNYWLIKKTQLTYLSTYIFSFTQLPTRLLTNISNHLLITHLTIRFIC
jgi:hypothetical protein